MANVSSPVQFVGGAEKSVTVPASLTTQALAIASGTLSGGLNVLTTVNATSGMALPVLPAGSIVIVTNTVATATTIYPPLGGTISAIASAGTLNAGVTLAASGQAVFIAVGSANGADFHRAV
jgi:hypothetical protein